MNKLVCPFGCQDSEIEDYGTFKTLVGFFGGPENDPNHHTTSAKCLKCNNRFDRHYVIKNKSEWYTDDNSRVLLGTPGCCESNYLTKCECGGWKKHSGGNAGIFSFNHKGPLQVMYYECNLCHSKFADPKYPGMMTENDVNEAQAKDIPPPESRKLNMKWTVKEEPGIGVINMDAIKNLTK